MNEASFLNQVVPLQTQMYRMAFSIMKNHFDAEDAVQDAMLKAWRRMDTLRDENVFTPWMKTILRNQCIEALRKNSRCIPCEMDDVPQEQTESPYSMAELFDSLNAVLRQTLWLHYGWGYKMREIAEMMRVPVTTVRSRLHRGRSIVRNTVDSLHDKQ